MTNRRVLNFGAGPACIPEEVLKKAQSEFLDFRGTGMSIMELSHRGVEYETVHRKASSDLQALLYVPDNYKILFLQGGGTLQFSAVVYNLLSSYRQRQKAAKANPVVDYLVTGTWSAKAAEEARRLGANVNVAVDAKAILGGYTGVPGRETWKLSGPEAAYVYYCDNETVNGVEFPEVPETHPSVPLVCDMSSNVLSRPVDVSRFGVIYAGAQKNIGPAGLTVVIVREDLLAGCSDGGVGNGTTLVTPLMLDYKLQADNNSLYNTPPMFAIYLSGLVFELLLREGGVQRVAEANERKARRLYAVVDGSNGFYRCPVRVGARSRMNVTFRLKTAELEEEFAREAEARGMVQLRGHRSVGGMRASIYNAMTEEGVETLAKFMEEFAASHGS